MDGNVYLSKTEISSDGQIKTSALKQETGLNQANTTPLEVDYSQIKPFLMH